MSVTADTPTLSRSDRARACWSALETCLLVTVPTLFLVVFVRVVLSSRDMAFDFNHAYWTAGRRVLDGGDPYLWTREEIRQGVAFVYPALSALVFAPLALMPRHFGSVLFTFVSIGMAPATVWVLRVRDWRIYAVVLLWLPVFVAWQTANETIFLVFGIACLWRYRDRPWVAALITVVEISLKPLMWPLAVWLLATRRWRASLYAAVLGLAINAAAWSVVGFGEIHAYLHASELDTRVAWHLGFGVAAFLAHVGLAHSVGAGATVVIALILVAAIAYAGLVKRDELQAMTLTIALILAASPMLWNHYFTLLIIPLALIRPRFNWLWLLPVLMWINPPNGQAHVQLWQAGVFAGVAVAVLGVLVLDNRRRELALG